MSKEPTRADLEFLADCLGTVEQRTIGGPAYMRHWARYGFIPDADLAKTVEIGVSDPIANARARSRITDLLRELPGDVSENGKPTNGRMLDPIANGRARIRMFEFLRALPLPRETAVLRPSA